MDARGEDASIIIVVVMLCPFVGFLFFTLGVGSIVATEIG